MKPSQDSAAQKGTGSTTAIQNLMRPRTRTRKRTYRLDICLDYPFNELAWDVIHSIERSELLVIDPDNGDALTEKYDDDGVCLGDSHATLSVVLADWLAVGCQRIRWHDRQIGPPLGGNVAGIYNTNLMEVIGFPDNESRPLGPGAFFGEIILPTRIRLARDDALGDETKRSRMEQAFQFIIAHEFLHVFETLPFLVPALMNWRKFWTNIVKDGCNSDLIWSRIDDMRRFSDDYGGEKERAMIEEWWPSRVETLWNARPWVSEFSEKQET